MSRIASQPLLRWAIVIVVTLAFFYGLDHLLMSVQGLPLSWNLAPRS